MAVPRETIWPIEPHTEAKHAILRKYLGAWLPIMTSISSRVLYVDGFAGPGRYTGGEEGSPLIALRAALEHPKRITTEVVFVFIEKDESRAAHLQGEIQQFSNIPSNFVIQSACSPFDDTLTDVLDSIDEQGSRLAPCFAFIDPFGFAQTPFSVVKRIMAHPRCEVLITFMYEFINRFLTHPDLGETFDRLFGTGTWRVARTLEGAAERRAFLHNLYIDQLRREAAIQYVRSFEMIDDGNRTEYFLFFGTNHITGLKKMKDTMWRVDKSGRFQFSDFTNPTQPVLFEAEPDFDHLERLLRGRFGGNQASVERIEQFIVVDTPFTDSHYKRGVLRKLEYANPPGLEIVAARDKRRRGTYPPGTIIRFL
ncbi:MAG: three-Cys-motif partner protein TcmP [Dehalococcoidia bacterium]